MSLSPRLETLASLIEKEYDHIWDCCCDHGFLGRSLMDRYPNSVVHFVDQVDSIIRQLQEALSSSCDLSKRWQVYCMDLNDLILPNSKESHLVIIAGVGGDLIAQFVENILKNNPGQRIDFLLCPIRQIYWLRGCLNDLGLGVIDEKIVSDKGLFYELLYISTSSDRPLSKTGDRMWDFTLTEHQAYIEQILKHYQSMRKGRPEEAASALSDYQQLLK